MCHGDAGQGEGPDGAHLAPMPANFTEPDPKKFPDSEWYWKVSYGIGNAAMPQWHLLLSPEDRWAAIKYVKATFVDPSEPADVSDVVPPAYQALDPAPYAPTPETIAAGKLTYERLCTGCHGPKGLGNGEYGAPLKPTPANLTGDPAVSAGIDFWYWRVDQGVVGTDPPVKVDGQPQGPLVPHPTAMPAWVNILDQQQKWEVIFYARQLVKAKGGPGGDQ
jgi:mono/diheme cytochrome c family protein